MPGYCKPIRHHGICNSIPAKMRLAERGGFEPPVRFAYTRFPSVLLKPLGHLSGGGEDYASRGRFAIISLRHDRVGSWTLWRIFWRLGRIHSDERGTGTVGPRARSGD